MDYKSETNDLRATYNRIAEDWFKDHNRDTWWVEGTGKFVSLLKAGASVLDVGCGAGVKSKWLLDKGLKVTGVDFSEKMIEIAKREVPDASFFIHDVRQPLPFRNTFDAVFVQALLLHIAKKEVPAVLGNILEKLKPGGYLYVAVKEVKPDRPEEEVRTENDYGYDYSRFFSYFTMNELKVHLAAFNLLPRYETRTPSGRSWWLQIIAQKAT